MTPQDIERRLLSGEPVTYGQLCLLRSQAELGEARPNYDPEDLINRTIQKLRREGRIAFRREGCQPVWRPTNEPAL